MERRGEANVNQIAGTKLDFGTNHNTHMHVWEADVSEF